MKHNKEKKISTTPNEIPDHIPGKTFCQEKGEWNLSALKWVIEIKIEFYLYYISVKKWP